MAPGDSGLALGGIFSEKLILELKKSRFGISPSIGPSFDDKDILKK